MGMLIAMSIWGFAWAIGKLAALQLALAPLIFWRFTISAAGLLVFLLASRQSLRLPRLVWLPVLVGGSSMALYNYFFFAGVRNGLSGAGGVLVTTTNPIITFLLVALFRRRLLKWGDILGLMLGFIGGMLMLRIWEIEEVQFLKSGNLFFLLASFTWAFSTFAGRRAGTVIPPVVFTFYTFFLAALLTFPFAGNNAGEQLLAAVAHNDFFIWQLLFLTVVTNSFATGIYFNATKVLGSSRASSFIFLVPATAMLGSWLIFGEKPQLTTLSGGALALLSVMILNRRPANERNLVGKV